MPFSRQKVSRSRKGLLGAVEALGVERIDVMREMPEMIDHTEHQRALDLNDHTVKEIRQPHLVRVVQHGGELRGHDLGVRKFGVGDDTDSDTPPSGAAGRGSSWACTFPEGARRETHAYRQPVIPSQSQPPRQGRPARRSSCADRSRIPAPRARSSDRSLAAKTRSLGASCMTVRREANYPRSARRRAVTGGAAGAVSTERQAKLIRSSVRHE